MSDVSRIPNTHGSSSRHCLRYLPPPPQKKKMITNMSSMNKSQHQDKPSRPPRHVHSPAFCSPPSLSHTPRRQRRLVVELAVHVAAEQGGPDLGQHLTGQQVQPRLQRVDDLNPVPLGLHLDTAAPEGWGWEANRSASASYNRTTDRQRTSSRVRIVWQNKNCGDRSYTQMVENLRNDRL